MTRVAIISDVHSDLHALRDALAQIERMDCEVIVCAGDVMDGEPFPEETIALLIECRIATIRGNHDRWALNLGSADDPTSLGDEHDQTGWDLSDKVLAFLRGLPLSWSATFDGVRVAVHHARVGSDMSGIYREILDDRVADVFLDAAQADVLIVGHTHVPLAYTTGAGRLIGNPGALLREGAAEHPAWVYDGERETFTRMASPPRGTFGVLHLPERRFVVHSAADGSVVLESLEAMGTRP